jgi:hypothetical protein
MDKLKIKLYIFNIFNQSIFKYNFYVTIKNKKEKKL